MKKLAYAIFLAGLLFAHTPVYADTKIGIIDTRKIVEESSAGKNLASQLKSRQEALQKEASAFEQKLKTEEQEIISKKKDMKPEEFAEKKKLFEQEYLKGRQTIFSKGSDLEALRKKGLAQLQKSLAKVSADVADEQKLQMIVDRQFVILAQDNMDITDVVMKKLDAEVKTIPLDSLKK